MIHRPLVSSLGLLALIGGCSGRSLVIGGDPNGEEGATGGVPTGGAFASGGVNAGGAFGSGGVSIGGTFPSGGASIGGSFPVGGSAGSSGASFGGTSTFGGTSAYGGTSIGGTSGSDVGPGGEGNFEPYPRVLWEMGQGYRSACPRWGDIWGFTCWNHQDSMSNSCDLDGSPYCNACSCAVPCDSEGECPETLTGFSGACLTAPMNVASCFVLCRNGTCPTGMTCSSHPGNGELVCIWTDTSVVN